MDLGEDIAAGNSVDAVEHSRLRFLAFSALLTTTRPSLWTTIETFKATAVGHIVHVIVAGARRYEDETRAEGDPRNANWAVRRMRVARDCLTTERLVTETPNQGA